MLRRLREAGERWGWRKVFGKWAGIGGGEREMDQRMYKVWLWSALFGRLGASVGARGAARAVMVDSSWAEARCCEAGFLE